MNVGLRWRVLLPREDYSFDAYFFKTSLTTVIVITDAWVSKQLTSLLCPTVVADFRIFLSSCRLVLNSGAMVARFHQSGCSWTCPWRGHEPSFWCNWARPMPQDVALSHQDGMDLIFDETKRVSSSLMGVRRGLDCRRCCTTVVTLTKLWRRRGYCGRLGDLTDVLRCLDVSGRLYFGVVVSTRLDDAWRVVVVTPFALLSLWSHVRWRDDWRWLDKADVDTMFCGRCYLGGIT